MAAGWFAEYHQDRKPGGTQSWCTPRVSPAGQETTRPMNFSFDMLCPSLLAAITQLEPRDYPSRRDGLGSGWHPSRHYRRQSAFQLDSSDRPWLILLRRARSVGVIPCMTATAGVKRQKTQTSAPLCSDPPKRRG